MDCRNGIPVIAAVSVLVAVVLLASAPVSGADPEGDGIPTDTYHKYTVTFRIDGVGMCDHFVLSFGNGYAVDSSVDDTDWIRVVYDPGTGKRTYIATYTYEPVPGTFDVDFTAYDSSGEGSTVSMRVVLLGYPVVSFAGEGTSGCSDITVYNGADHGCYGYEDYYARIQEPASPEREGSLFLGWFTDEECTVPYEWDSLVKDDITLYAGWEDDPETVEIVFRNADGKVYSDRFYDVGAEIRAPADPSMPPTETEVFAFAGWSGFTEGMVAERDSVFTAVFEGSERLYSITYYVERQPFIVQKYPFGAEITFPTEVPEVEGYVFTGWKNHSMNMVVTADSGFCAVLEPLADTVFKVSYVVDGNVMTSFVPYGSPIDLGVPVKPGYRFTMWYVDEACTVPADLSSITADTEVYAGFQKEVAASDTDDGSFNILLVIGAFAIIVGCLVSATGARRNAFVMVGGIVVVIAGGCMMTVSGGFL